MHRRVFLTSLAGAAVPLASAFAAPEIPGEQPPKVPLRASIAIPIHHGHRSLNSRASFSVVITNTSPEPIRLWAEPYSWGYYNLRFEVIAADNSVTVVKKKPRGWNKNFPDWFELTPGEYYVRNVSLYSSNEWENVPASPRPGRGPRKIRMRAVYEIKPDAQSGKHGVWTGKITSPVGDYAIW